MERYEALVYHILYRALLVETKIDNGFFKYVVDRFDGMLDSVPHKDRYTVLSHSIQRGLHPSAILLIEKGANFHAVGYDYPSVITPWNHEHEHTITSKYLHAIASQGMLMSKRFFKWRYLLLQANISLA